jgi:hypothetical protein
MKNYLFILPVIALIFPSMKTEKPLSSKPITVVELFTSQGCSSCPSADLLLNKVVEEKGSEVIGLSFHVSYWNYLGWKDPYSSEQFTERQRTYASIKRLNSIYTPQMIVDGREEFVGSDKRALEASLERSKNRTLEFDIKATSLFAEGVFNVNYSIAQVAKGEVINLAIVEKLAENYVPRGENSGLTLRHHNVVKIFKTQELKQEGEFSIPLISDKKLFAVLYIQDKATLETKGAVQINF